MNRRSPNFDTVITHKFMDFVYDHERPARWMFRDDARSLPYDYVDFKSDEVGNTDSEFSAFPPLGEYVVRVHMRDPHREAGQILPFVEVALKQGKFAVVDDYDRMRQIVEGYRHSEETFSYAANVLIDTLRLLEIDGVMVPAGMRRANLANQIDEGF